MQSFKVNCDFPYEIKNVSSLLQNKLKIFRSHTEGFVEVGDEKWIMPKKYEKFSSEIYNFEARPSDVFICTHPRSGTTITQELIWLLCNDLNYEEASTTELSRRFPFME